MAIRLVRRTGTIRLNPQAAADAVGDAIVKQMRARIAAGVDGAGNPLPGYSTMYRMQLAALGESTKVDLSRSGRFLQDLRVLEIQVNGPRVTIKFGAGNSTSPRTSRPPPWVFIGTASQQAKAMARWRAAPKKVTQSEPHSQLLARIIGGGAGGLRPPRNILGVPPAMRGEIVKALEQAKIFNYG